MSHYNFDKPTMSHRPLVIGMVGGAGAVLVAQACVSLASASLRIDPNIIQIGSICTGLPMSLETVGNLVGLAMTSFEPAFPNEYHDTSKLKKIFRQGTLLSLTGVAIRFSPQIIQFVDLLAAHRGK